MFAAKSLSAALFLAVALASTASATVVNFNGLAGTNVAGNTAVYAADTQFSGTASFTNNGFKFTGTNGYDLLIGTTYSNSDSAPYAFNGTDYFMASSTFRIDSATAAPFSLNSIDLAQWSDGNGVTQATLTGTQVDGTVVSRVLTLNTGMNANTRIGNDFTSFALTGLTDLNSLTISHNGGYYVAVDNLVLNATTVPEPSSIMLFGLALAAGAVVRRRRA